MVEFRELRTAAALAVLPRFEQQVWGGEQEVVSVNMLVATIAEGGVAIGAFDGAELVGSVYGFPTSDPRVLHSHYLAVASSHRGRGIGVELKMRQRRWCLERGLTAMRWTFDPLQLANAHLNLRVLGAFGERYHVDYYGTLGGINGSLPSDRVVVRWQLNGDPPPGSQRRTVLAPRISPQQIAAADQVAHAARLHLRAELEPWISRGWVLVDVDVAASTYFIAR